jgi:hypothetical protein
VPAFSAPAPTVPAPGPVAGNACPKFDASTLPVGPNTAQVSWVSTAPWSKEGPKSPPFVFPVPSAPPAAATLQLTP